MHNGWIRFIRTDRLHTVCKRGRVKALILREQLNILKFQVGEPYDHKFLCGVYGKTPYFKYRNECRNLYRWYRGSIDIRNDPKT